MTIMQLAASLLPDQCSSAPTSLTGYQCSSRRNLANSRSAVDLQGLPKVDKCAPAVSWSRVAVFGLVTLPVLTLLSTQGGGDESLNQPPKRQLMSCRMLMGPDCSVDFELPFNESANNILSQ